MLSLREFDKIQQPPIVGAVLRVKTIRRTKVNVLNFPTLFYAVR